MKKNKICKTDMKQQFLKNLLKKIEKLQDIRIIFAIEWGSRCYGLYSDESDFDIRFIYVHNDKEYYNEYLKIKSKKRRQLDLEKMNKIKKETITGKNYIQSEKIDWQGWDITKAIKHLMEMNPSIVEFVYSTTIYRNDINYDFLNNAKSFLESQRRLTPMIRHYRLMAKKYYTKYIENNQACKIKKYMVAIRCCVMYLMLLNSEQIELFELNIDKALEKAQIDIPDEVLNRIHEVIEQKRDESMDGKKISLFKIVNQWIEDIVCKEDVVYEIKFKSNQIIEKLNALNLNLDSPKKYNEFLYQCLELNLACILK